MKAISYSLFNYGKQRETNCFDFDSYARGLHICIRFNRILYPEWVNVLNIDEATYNSPYKPIFDWHVNKGWLRISVQESAPLCKGMLWRFKTVFDYDHPEWRYTHVICRDLDSISTFREAQMVAEWVQEDKAMHCITDSISHTIPMMGGLVGFRPGYVNDLLNITEVPAEEKWATLLNRAPGIDYSVKGSDQTFLNQVIYPSLCEHATEHFIKGRPHNRKEENGRHYSVDEYTEIGVDRKFEETNLLAGHAGAAGYYQPATEKFLYHNDPFKSEYDELERLEEFKQVFYWYRREDLR